MNAASIKTVLNGLTNLPAPVKSWEIDTGTDVSGDDAVPFVSIIGETFGIPG
jgi:hypothetical protein